MIDYQRALARAVVAGDDVPIDVPGVSRDGVTRLAEIALRKRAAAARALLPRTCAQLGRAAFDARYRAFARPRGGVGPQKYRDEAIAFACSLNEPVARTDARLARAHDPERSFAVVREGGVVTLFARLRRGGRLHVMRLLR
ncbi:MAG: hypothetical protein JO036_00400 [Candidatus Eremiobacteraeota bacterium]|nr:hypothetical protein [Candidatus Eremiobacteraeota bacterium]